jgi:death-on-curing protein
MLMSAIERPFQTFDSKELYPTPVEKAAALAESLIINHPFVDGNKRTGMLAMLTLLKHYDITLTASDDALYDFIVAISTGEQRYDEIKLWLGNNAK